MMAKITLGMLAAVGFAGQARAAGDFFEGNQLYAYCTSSFDYERGLCLGYIEGVVEYMEAVRSNNGKPRCVPPGTDSKAAATSVALASITSKSSPKTFTTTGSTSPEMVSPIRSPRKVSTST